MAQIEIPSELNFLSELYAQDAPQARLLAEYPSSNSLETNFQNRSKYIIHDPFPPPRRELIKILGPHHLMCGWGRHLSVTSEIPPPTILVDHWETLFGRAGCPDWQPFKSQNSQEAQDSQNSQTEYITLFPHESLPAQQQVIDPDRNYAVHSKEVIEAIDCPQADVLESVVPPCIVKLSHGYAGLGNFFIRNRSDEREMRQQLAAHWPQASLVINSIIENITGDFGIQFYLRRNGTIVWLGLTEQRFDQDRRWCGGTFSANLQTDCIDDFWGIIEPVGNHLHEHGYFGLVGIDVLRDRSNRFYLVDVNPRLTGITPFLIASRIFARDGMTEGIYLASCRFKGTCQQLIAKAEQTRNARVVVLSVYEERADSADTTTLCHLSVSSESQSRNQQILRELF